MGIFQGEFRFAYLQVGEKVKTDEVYDSELLSSST